MMTLEEVWENLRQNPETKATMEEVDKSYKLFKKIENLIVADLEAELEEREKKQKYLFSSICEYVSQIEELKQQLAEKDQAIEGLQEINQSLGQTCNNDAKEIERLREKLANTTVFAPKISNNAELVIKIIQSDADGIDYLKQQQNQTAIAEIEKVKELIKNNIVGMGIPSQKHFISPIIDGIDQQIKELKGDADEKI